MHTEPETPRYTVDFTPQGLRAVIPARRSWVGILFMCAWLGGWAMGERQAIAELRAAGASANAGFLLLWLTAWTAAGGATMLAIAWQLAGREVIALDGATLAQRLELFGLGRRRAWPVAEIKNLRMQTPAAAPPASQRAWRPPPPGVIRGLVFDHDGRTIRLARRLDEAQASLLANELAARLPRKLLD